MPDDDARRETEKERVDREYFELLNEIRVTLPGVQVILAFLLTAPFTDRFGALSVLQKEVYFAALLCVAVANALLMAPAAHHRLRFRAGDKEWILLRTSGFALVATGFVVAGLSLSLFVVTDMLFSHAAAVVVASAMAALLVGLWYAAPLLRRQAR